MVNPQWYLIIYHLSGKSQILDELMIFGAVYMIFFAAILAVMLAVIYRSQELKALIISVVAGPLGILIIKTIRVYFVEPRPFIALHTHPLIKVAIDAAYPSEHTTAMAILFFSFLLTKSKFWPVFLICLVWVGFARIFVGVHYPFDIIGGILVGIICAYLSKLILVWIKKLVL